MLGFSLDGNSYRVNNIYALSQCLERLNFWNRISILQSSEHINMIGGDFNCVLYLNRDRRSMTPYYSDPSSLQVFKKLVNFIDCYPSNSSNPLFTFSMNTQSGPLLLQLDYTFIDSSQSHLQTKTSTFYTNSDHLAVKTEFFLLPTSLSNNI